MAALYLGLMSGTSQDGVDAVVASFRDNRLVKVHGHATVRYPTALRRRLLELASGQSVLTLADYASVDTAVAQAFAGAAHRVLKRCQVAADKVTAIGSHGQTVFHVPGRGGNSLQLGDPSRIAALTGITTVADFRRADIATGGQGAPLVPGFHAAQFGSPREDRVVLNLGGIANVSILAAQGRVSGFDTGPGNALLDEWAQLHLGRPFDAGGRWAAAGAANATLLKALLSDPWFRRAPPKSTGRDRFNLRWVRRRYPGLRRLDPRDVQRTLAALSARTAASAIERHAVAARRVLVCGGGVRNAVLMTLLREQLSPRTVESTARHGLDPQQVEAAAFAWLAMRTVTGQSGNIPVVTGAKREVVLGGIYPGRSRPRRR